MDRISNWSDIRLKPGTRFDIENKIIATKDLVLKKDYHVKVRSEIRPRSVFFSEVGSATLNKTVVRLLHGNPEIGAHVKEAISVI